MERLQALLRALLLLGAVIGVQAAAAHAFWLVPHGPRPDAGEQVAFDLRIGAELPGERTPRLDGLVDYFTLFDTQGSEPVRGRKNAVPVGHVRVRQPGAAVAALRTLPRPTDMTAPEFEKYVDEEAMGWQIPDWRSHLSPAAKIRDEFSRCAKSVLLVGGSSAGFDRVTGMPFELTPQTDPLQMGPGKTFGVRLFLKGQPASGYWVKARPIDGAAPVTLRARTDAAGMVRFTLPRDGLWLFDTVHIGPSASLDADWESLWASLTIDLGKP